MFVLIPCKSLSAGKSRLSACLDAPRRRALCEYFLTRTLELALAVTSPERVRLVTSDADAIAVATSCSVATLADAAGELNRALSNARHEMEGRSPGRLMILPTDLPYVTLNALHEATHAEADVVIASDEGGRGTNLLVLSEAARRLPFAFGTDSFGAHSNAARAAGLSLHVLRDWRVARDIDEPEQYLAWTKSADFPRHLVTTDRAEPLAGSMAAP